MSDDGLEKGLETHGPLLDPSGLGLGIGDALEGRGLVMMRASEVVDRRAAGQRNVQERDDQGSLGSLAVEPHQRCDPGGQTVLIRTRIKLMPVPLDQEAA